jgi:thiamine-phosphate pyrophosphorylase
MAFSLPRFYPILDTAVLCERALNPVHVADVLLDAGACIMQYRHKDSWTQQHFDEAQAVADLCKNANAAFVMNDRADYAALLNAALHLGQRDLPPVAARQIVPKSAIGFSTHNRSQLMRAQEEPVDYFSIGPVFGTSSKLRPDPELGLDAVASLSPLSRKPLVAIGGINLQNAPQVLQRGVASVAVIAGLLSSEDGLPAVRNLARDWVSLAR